jgi:DUF4097 and DUF4098 domain-containing protein YvlB
MFISILRINLLLFAVLFMTEATLAQTQGTPYESKEFNVRPGAVVKVKTISGNIVVRGTDGNTVRVELFVKKGLGFFQRGQQLDDANILIYQRDNEIVADIQPRRSDAWTSSSTQYHFVISVPNRTSCQLSATGGKIELSNVDGSHSLKTAGGDILIEGTSGEIKAYTTGGNIRGEDVRGLFFAQSVGGNIDLNSISGETRFRVSGGNLSLHRMNGTVIGETMGGGIVGDILSIMHGIDLTATGGNIDLSIPGLAGMTMNIRGNRVEVNRLRNFEGEIKSNSISGTLNGGGLPIKLRSAGGVVDLNVKQDRP